MLSFDLYMIGRTEEFAKPTIIFSSENKTQRQRAQKLVRESGVLNQYPGIRLGESSRPLRLCRTSRPLCDQSSPGDIEMLDYQDSPAGSDACVYYSAQTNGFHGIAITVPSRSMRKSTLGLVCIKEELFGLTVAHAFCNDLDNEETNGGDMEFSLEDDDGDESEYRYSDSFIDITSRGESRARSYPNFPHEALINQKEARRRSTGLKKTTEFQESLEMITSNRSLRTVHIR